jgi:hypothetical protein
VCPHHKSVTKFKVTPWISAASEVGWRSKENETKMSFRSCGKWTFELEMTTGENQTGIQVILYAKSHTQHSVVTDWYNW